MDGGANLLKPHADHQGPKRPSHSDDVNPPGQSQPGKKKKPERH
jgi:hypothetical protein